MSLDIPYFWVFLLLVLIVAFLYSGAGHGGASGYLALMSMFCFSPEVMKPTALLLNLFVAGISAFHYYKAGYLNLKLFGYFAISSVPMAFLGGSIGVDPIFYKKILGVLLLFAILKMLNIIEGKKEGVLRSVKRGYGLLIGAVIGFFSGVIGIGGGIILSPVILLLHWGKIKESAAVSALFIWVNSVAGLTASVYYGASLSNRSLAMVGVAVVGGFLGSYYGSGRISNKRLRHLLAFVLIIASVKLIFL